jgi:hypothetical protein
MEKVEIIKSEHCFEPEPVQEFKSNGKKLVLDTRILDVIGPKLVDDWISEGGIFTAQDKVLPQNHLYDLNLSSDQLDRILFYTCIGTVYGASSDYMYQQIRESVLEHDHLSEMFDDHLISEIPTEELVDNIKKLGIHRQNEMAGRWQQTAKYLKRLNIERPSLLIEQSGSITQFLKDHCASGGGPINGIHGIAGKTASLFAVFCKEQQRCENIYDAFPVDIWITRICIQTGYLSGCGYWNYTSIEKILRPRLAFWCLQNNIEVPYLNGALWRLGATQCAKAPSCDNSICSVENECLGTVRGITPGSDGKRGLNFDLINKDGLRERKLQISNILR